MARLREDAAALERRFPRAEDRPPLYGVLVGVKDIFHVDGFVTRAGSRLPPERLQGPEAECVSRLKRAGALILGKTVTTEFAYFSPGPTRNPRNPDHTPGGSSSGSAAAVAAGLCPLALGTQTAGSIIRPAAFCGVVGLKPTFDRISTAGVIPFAPSLDHVGLFAPDVAMAGRCAAVVYRDWAKTTAPSRRPTLGIPEGPYLQCASGKSLEWFRLACRTLADEGYEVRSVPALIDYARVRAQQDVIMAAEVAKVHARWFEQYAQLYSPKMSEIIRRGQTIADAELGAALAGRDRLRVELRQAMADHGIDAWIAPSAPGPAPRGLESTGDPVMNVPWTQAGLPAINLPAGTTRDGLPIGMQVVADWGADERLLDWAEEMESVGLGSLIPDP